MRNILKKYKYLLLIVVFLVVILFTIFYYNKYKVSNKIFYINSNSQNTSSVYSDPNCNGDQNKYADAGFGVEHIYTGEIKKDIHVKIVLSCNQDKLTISGSVNQVITVDDIKKILNESDVDFVDLSMGSEVVNLDSDYNFDEYNDLSVVSSNGSGVDSYNIFLYDPTSNKFIFNKDLSSIQNIIINEKAKLIISDMCYEDDTICKPDTYKWLNGKLNKQ